MVIVDSSTSESEVSAADVESSDSEECGDANTVLVGPRENPSSFGYKKQCGGWQCQKVRFDSETPAYLTLQTEVRKDLYRGDSRLAKATSVASLWQSRRRCAETPFERAWDFNS